MHLFCVFFFTHIRGFWQSYTQLRPLYYLFLFRYLILLQFTGNCYSWLFVLFPVCDSIESMANCCWIFRPVLTWIREFKDFQTLYILLSKFAEWLLHLPVRNMFHVANKDTTPNEVSEQSKTVDQEGFRRRLNTETGSTLGYFNSDGGCVFLGWLWSSQSYWAG